MSADVTFRAMGSEMPPDHRRCRGTGDDEPDPDRAAAEAREFIERFEACLSRFRPESELCALNADPRPVVPASPLLRDAVAPAWRPPRATGGLVDPTLVDEIEAAGYVYAREGHPAGEAGGRSLLRPAAPPGRTRARAAAGRHRGRRGVRGRSAVRPASGSTAAGSARAWPPTCWPSGSRDHQRFVIDCGGDLRVGGRRPRATSRSSSSTR